MTTTERAYEYIHGCHIPYLEDGTDAVIVKVHMHEPDGTVVPKLKLEDKLIRPYWLTKPQCRNHEFKKEWELVKNLDRYDVPNYRLEDELSNSLNGPTYGRSRRRGLTDLCSSPYVYGADMHIECLLKKKYQVEFAKSGKSITKTTSGFLDIETDMFDGKGHTPNIISVTHENKVYTAILDKFFVMPNGDGTFRRGNLEEFKILAKETLDHHILELLTEHTKKHKKSPLLKRLAASPFEYEYYIGETPLSLIQWIFSKIHENKTDFIGIWNLDFDIPKIMNEIKNSGARWEDIFCPPELPKKYRYVKYARDEKEAADIYKKWHWLHATSYSQFIDSMCLYRILRTVKGIETGGMSLDNVLKGNDLGGKLTFKDDDPATDDMSGADWHRHMQRNEAYKYIMYNQFDVISIQLMEWKNDDLGSMNVLGGISRLCKWTRQTRKVSDALYFDALEAEEPMVTASPGSKDVMFTKYDALMQKVGGAVLRPERTTNIGLRIFSDRPDIVTFLHNFVSDVDFTGMYPNADVVANISKETKISSAVQIEGFSKGATQNFYSLMISVHENAVLIGSTYFNLPTYETMDSKFETYLKGNREFAPR